jgi:phage tail-like protein
MAVQRMAMGAAKVAIGNAAEKVLGLPVLARELEDPMGSYVFALEINGVELAHFQECSGLKGSTEIFEIREGGMNAAVHKIPGQSTWDNLVLRYGVSSEQSMMQLRQVVQQDTYNPNSKSEFDKVKVGSSAGNALANLTAGLFQNKTAPAPKRFNGSIVIKNNRMQEMMRYSFQNSWVVSWEGPKFDSTNSSLAIETIEIAHHGIEVVTNWRTAIPIGWT